MCSSEQNAVDDSYSNIPDDLDTVIERAGNQIGSLSNTFRQYKNMLQGACEELQKVADSINKHLTENNKPWNQRSKSQEIYNSICTLLNDLDKLIQSEGGNQHSAWSEFCESSETTFKNLKQSIGQLKKGARLFQQKQRLLDLVKKFETFVKKWIKMKILIFQFRVRALVIPFLFLPLNLKTTPMVFRPILVIVNLQSKYK